MHEVKTIQGILEQISHNEILLPEFQRGYVWNRDQVRRLVQSLYHKHPTGHLLIWRTYRPSLARGSTNPESGHSLMLLDGQQRLTTLYVLFKGQAPRFYEGESLFFNLYFNLQTEEFRYWQKSTMENNPAWIGVHDFLSKGLDKLLNELDQMDANLRTVIQGNLAKLGRLNQIRDYTYTIDQVSGEEFSLDEVVKIFNQVNAAGTPLTKADLALAHVCSIWPEARDEMRKFRSKMDGVGFGMEFDFFLRCLAGISTGAVGLEGALLKLTSTKLKEAWKQLQSAFVYFVSILRHEAFVEGLSDIPATYPLVPVTIYLAHREGQFPNDLIKRRFIRWFFLAGIWGRYSGSSETKLQQDVALVTGNDEDPTHELEEAILHERGRVKLEALDLSGVRTNTAIGCFSRIVARAHNGRDWFTGKPLYDKVTGKSEGVEHHHIFSKKVLAQAGFKGRIHSKIVNEVSNRAILTRPAGRKIAKMMPDQYLMEIQRRLPESLKAQSIPMDSDLWTTPHYYEFLAERRRLLAISMNEFIDSWIPEGDSPSSESIVREIIDQGENHEVEFKASLRWDLKLKRVNRSLEKVVAKTVAGFLNSSDGGTLLIGVDDDGKPCGLAHDFRSLQKDDRDGFELQFYQIVEKFLGAACSTFIMTTFHSIDGHDIFHVKIEPSDHEIYLDDKPHAIFFLRVGNATKPLPIDETVWYVKHRWGRP